MTTSAQDVADWVLSWPVDPVHSKDDPGTLDFKVTINRPAWAEDSDETPETIEVVLDTGLPEMLWTVVLPDTQETIRNKVRYKVYEQMLLVNFGELPAE